MRTLNVSRSSAVLSAALASMFTLTACASAPDGQASTDEAVTRAAPASGVDVFKGVVFGTGPLAAKLSMWSPETRAKVAAIPAPVQIAKLENALSTMRSQGWSAEAIAHTEQTLTMLRQGAPLPQADAARRAKQEDFVIAHLAKTDPTFFQRFGVEMQSGNPVRVEAAFSEARDRLHAMSPHAARGRAGEGDGDSGPVVVYVFIVLAVLVWLVQQPGDQGRLATDHLVAQLTDELHAR
jgi:hypothetical protein